jgi:single-strand DNA-binding protein
MFDTQVTVVGNLVADPRLTSTPNGQPVASFRLASTPRRFDRAAGEWRDGATLFVNVTCWRGLAENVATSLKKGQAAIVIGRLSVRPYASKDGEKRQSVDIDAMAVGPDLSRVVTVVKRAERGVVPSSADPWVTETAGSLSGAEHQDAAVTERETDDLETDDLQAEDLETDDADGAGGADDVHDLDRDGGDSQGASGVDESMGGVLAAAGAGGRLKARFGIG